jgi:hypothetical protein
VITIKALQEAYGEAMLELRARKNAVPVGQGRDPPTPHPRSTVTDVELAKIGRYSTLTYESASPDIYKLRYRCSTSSVNLSIMKHQ